MHGRARFPNYLNDFWVSAQSAEIMATGMEACSRQALETRNTKALTGPGITSTKAKL